MFFSDLTPYTYLEIPAELDDSSSFPADTKALNIGWLAKENDYNRGEVPQYLIEQIERLIESPTNLCWGFHECEFCEVPLVAGEECDKEIMGNGEIHVKGATGKIYSAPVLILHYIKVHHYLPPEEFLAALEYQLRKEGDV